MSCGRTRREFLARSGSLAVGFCLLHSRAAQAQAKRELPVDLKQSPKIDSWIRIEAGGKVKLLVGKVELGQGILTAVTQICADELDVDLKRISIVSGDTSVVPPEGTTAGSFSVVECGTAVRHAAAETRYRLLEMAATRWNTEARLLRVEDGVVSDGAHTASYWELVNGLDLAVEVTGEVQIKPQSERRYIGNRVERIDIPAKIFGQQIFIQDLRLEGMLHGRVVHPPAHGMALANVDQTAVEKLPGIVKIVRDGSFLGVIARDEYQAVRAARELAPASKWVVKEERPELTEAGIYDWLLEQKPAAKVVHDEQHAGSAAAAGTLEASYRRPYQLHGSIGPSTAIAMANADGSFTVYTHSQSVFETGAAIAEMLGVPASKVRCVHHQGSGCYGHNAADDVAAEAALLARAVSPAPVRIQWSRQDEHRWEPYGSAMVVNVKASVDRKGEVLDWALDLWSMPHGTRPSNKAGNLLPARFLEKPFPMPVPRDGGPPNYAAARNAITLYDFPGQKVTTHFITEMPLRTSSMRSLGAYTNVFAIESFVDELAQHSGADPVEYRLRMLSDERARDVIRKAAEAFGWNSWKKKSDTGKGFAFARYKNLAAYLALAIEVQANRESGVIRVNRVSAACDVGTVVNPDGVANQIEGGIIQSLSWTLKEAVHFRDGEVKSVDWFSYPILRFSEVPAIEVHVLDRPDQPFLGAGEASQGPTAAALANAVADACGLRLREIPFTPARVKQTATQQRTYLPDAKRPAV
jgi:nicotinate dehydrogenase subunit B